MTFPEFLALRNLNLLNTIVAWRAYDIVGYIRRRHVVSALKALGYDYAGELAIPEVMAHYGINNRTEATQVLGAWWLVSQIETGQRFRGLPLRKLKEAREGDGLPT